jgi:coenzyme F420-reducing hydrogenase beta subunit
MEDARQALPRGCTDVVDGSWCIGCGACAIGCPHGRIVMTLTEQGAYEPRVEGECPGSCTACERVCPFALEPRADEDVLAAERFGRCEAHRGDLGWFDSVLVGGVRDHDARQASASGGIGTWLTSELLTRGEADAVITVGPIRRADGAGVTAAYRVCRTPEELRSCAGSHYCPAHLDEVLAASLARGERVAIVAVPCVAKAVRLLQAAVPGARDGVVAVIGLVCGQSKTWGFTRSATEATGVGWDDVAAVRYRRKRDESPASRWLLEVTGTGGERTVSDFPIRAWADRAFTLGACEACDDVFAECADVTLMDAWAQPHVSDPRGTSAVITRTEAIGRVLADGVVRGELELAALDPATAAHSQASVVDQKRIGLAYRLGRWAMDGTPAPRKRVGPDPHAGGLVRRAIWRLEMTIAEESRLTPWGEAAAALERVAGKRRRLQVLRRLRNLESRLRGGR